MEPLQLSASQFIDEALTRFDSEYGDRDLTAKVFRDAFRLFVMNEIDGEVRRVEKWIEPGRTARKAAADAYPYLDTLKMVSFTLHCGPFAGKPGGASPAQLGLCRKVVKVLVEKYGADPTWLDGLRPD